MQRAFSFIKNNDNVCLDITDELHNELTTALVCDYLDEKVDNGRAAKRFRLEARRFLKTAYEQSHKDAIDVLDVLVSKGHIAPGRYDKLKELVKPIDERMVELIENTEKQMEHLKDDEGKIIIFILFFSKFETDRVINNREIAEYAVCSCDFDP